MGSFCLRQIGSLQPAMLPGVDGRTRWGSLFWGPAGFPRMRPTFSSMSQVLAPGVAVLAPAPGFCFSSSGVELRAGISNKTNVLQSRYYFADKGQYSQSYGFSGSHVRMWELDHKEGWALKDWCFRMWCWRKLLKVSWTARRLNQWILKEINPKYSSEGLALKLQSFGHLMQRADSLEKTLMLGKIEGRRRRGR